MSQLRVRQRLGRICKNCENRYVPTGKCQKYCESCQKESNNMRFKKIMKTKQLKKMEEKWNKK